MVTTYCPNSYLASYPLLILISSPPQPLIPMVILDLLITNNCQSSITSIPNISFANHALLSFQYRAL